MADTKQSVKWTLVQCCALRPEAQWSNPLLQKARLFGREHQAREVTAGFEGICVSMTCNSDIPYSGFLIEKEFAIVGGSIGLQKLCGDCPANAALEGVAGCTGWLYHGPYAAELDEELRQIGEELDLAGLLEDAFPSTALLWFGFWIDASLSEKAMRVLVPLLSEFAHRHSANHSEHARASLEQFVRAMERALLFGLELRVEMAPPGHSDFGWWTTFPHCPRCKAGALPMASWGKVPHDWLLCAMCGHAFDPAPTASSKRSPWELEDEKLLQVLGETRFREFAVAFLEARGRPAEEARIVVEKHLAPPDPAVLEKRRQQKLKLREKRRFLCTVLCAGFERLRPDAPQEPEERVSSDYLLCAAEVELLLERARQCGAKVSTIAHIPSPEELESDEETEGEWVLCRDFDSPEAAFKDLQSRGCDLFFRVSVGIPDAAWEAWKAAQNQLPHE